MSLRDPKPGALLEGAALKSQLFVNTSASAAFAGITTILSGTQTSVVSTTEVASNSLVFHSLNKINNGSNDTIQVHVASQIDATSITFAADKAPVTDIEIAWEIRSQV